MCLSITRTGRCSSTDVPRSGLGWAAILRGVDVREPSLFRCSRGLVAGEPFHGCRTKRPESAPYQ
jgi:hypothetical protein